ncbi:MAG: antitoxin [Thainema sp.]
MSISLDLPEELETELSQEAARLNMPLAEYILRILTVRPPLQNPPKNGAELVAYWEKVGVIGSRPDIEIAKDNPWQPLFESLDQFSDDFMVTREQPPLDIREAF